MSPERIDDLAGVSLNIAAGMLVSGFIGAIIQSNSVVVAALTAGISLVWFFGFLYIGLSLKESVAWKQSSGAR